VTKLEITVAAWDYDRVRPIMDGRVSIEGCSVNFVVIGPEECFHRAWLNGDFDVTEIGLGAHLIATSRGEAPYVGVPAFVSRMFRHSALYIRSDRGITTPADLRDKLVGVPEYQIAAALWVRGFLADDYGVMPDEVRWRQAGQRQAGRAEKWPNNLPPDFPLEPLPEGLTLDAALEDGALDAVITPRVPRAYSPGGTVVRLFEDFETVEADYYTRTGVFPTMHAVGIRRDVFEQNPWLATSVFKAFQAAKEIAVADLHEAAALKTTLPWGLASIARAEAILGPDIWPYGFDENRRTLEAMARYAWEQGMLPREVAIEELFAPSTLKITAI
jgi:4,5-dihydroxyphthalate decarboxylase